MTRRSTARGASTETFRYEQPGRHQRRPDRRAGDEGSVSCDSVHAAGDRRRGKARCRRGCGDRAHPRPQPRGRSGVARRNVRGDPHRGPGTDGCDRQLFDRGHRHSGRGACRPHPRAAARARGFEHGLDELRHLLGEEESLLSRSRLREPLQGHPVLPRGDECRRRPARARVFRHGPYREHRAADRHGRPQAALPVQPDHGRAGWNPRHDASPEQPGRDLARRFALAGHRDRSQPVAPRRGRYSDGR